jgi:predicted alpha-1,2-mannosidase
MIINKRALNTSGYYYPDNKIIGFSHTRLAGTGATDGGHILVFPTTEIISEKTDWQYMSTVFSHADEIAFPGYYAVRLTDTGVLAELTATERVGVHRYTFPNGVKPSIIINVTNALGDKKSKEGSVRIIHDANEIEGSVRTFGSFAGRYGGVKIYFVARFDQPFSDFMIWNKETFTTRKTAVNGDKIGVCLSFEKNNPINVILLKVAISYVSIQNAHSNLNAEAAEAGFDDIVTKAKAAWEQKLALIKIEGQRDDQKTIFYTALFHALQMPTIFSDINGEYIGFDKKVHMASDFSYYTDLSLWDTFRTVHPLFNLIVPDYQRDMLVSLVRMSKEGGGWLPRWPSGNGYTNSMLGSPADMVIVESYLKGIRNFDIKSAYQAMRQTALAPTPRGGPYSGREGIAGYLEYQYCPAELMDEAVSRTLEFAYADHSISLLATELGYEEDSAQFAKHAQYYRNLWNPMTQYFQPRDTLAQFIEPFKPLLLTYLDREGVYTSDYVEGSALQWRWAVPFDPEGFIALFKNKEFFISELNDFFALSDPTMGAWNPGSYYWHGNEPDIFAPYLFNNAGRPDLTQKWVRWIIDHKYGIGYDGLDGNDDSGTLSAWYIFSALGFYPVAGTDIYQLGAPLFKNAYITIREKQLKIIADNYSPTHIYVQKIWLNDTLLDRTWLAHAEIAGGGLLRFEMGDQPKILNTDDQENGESY